MSDLGYIDGMQGRPSPVAVKVTVRDLETGDEESIEIRDDYVLICAGSCYLAHTQASKNGTHVLTVKGRASR